MKSIIVQDVVKKYKNGVIALDGISLTVEEGEVFSLLGQNGAGKSTLINILTTFLAPTSGNVSILGMDLDKKSSEIRRVIACAHQQVSIDTFMSLEENMMFQSRLYRVKKQEAKKRMEQLIECFDLERYLKYPIVSYSGGIKRRLDIALGMMSNPKILFLDEPTVGMDIQSRKSMWDMMRKIKTEFNTTIYLTSHYMEEVDMLSDHVCIMREGKAVIQGTPTELKDYLHKNKVVVHFSTKAEAEQVFQTFSQEVNLPDMELVQADIQIPVDPENYVFRKMNYYLLENEIDFMGIEISKPSLEEVFIDLTKNSRKGGK